MNHPDLPPLPESGAHGPQACAVMRLYLAVLDDVPADQVRLVFEHIHACPACAAELHLFTWATQLISGAANLEPPLRVDQAVLAAIATGVARVPLNICVPWARTAHRTITIFSGRSARWPQRCCSLSRY